MLQSLRKYLFLYKKLHFPGIGTFLVEDIPARLDFSTKQLHAPVPVIRFSLEKTATDRHFFDFLADDLSSSEVEVVRQFTDYIYHLKTELNNNNVVDLPGIGLLKKEFANTYSFQPANPVMEYFPQVAAYRVEHGHNEMHSNPPVIEEEAIGDEYTHSPSARNSNDYWWAYALGLMLLGVGALVYYYYYLNTGK